MGFSEARTRSRSPSFPGGSPRFAEKGPRENGQVILNLGTHQKPLLDHCRADHRVIHQFRSSRGKGQPGCGAFLNLTADRNACNLHDPLEIPGAPCDNSANEPDP
jgi:hypothetical protein